MVRDSATQQFLGNGHGHCVPKTPNRRLDGARDVAFPHRSGPGQFLATPGTHARRCQRAMCCSALPYVVPSLSSMYHPAARGLAACRCDSTHRGGGVHCSLRRRLRCGSTGRGLFAVDLAAYCAQRRPAVPFGLKGQPDPVLWRCPSTGLKATGVRVARAFANSVLLLMGEVLGSRRAENRASSAPIAGLEDIPFLIANILVLLLM